MARDQHRRKATNPTDVSDVAVKRQTHAPLDAKNARLFPAVSPDTPPPEPSRWRYVVLLLAFLAVVVSFAAKTQLVRFAGSFSLMALALLTYARMSPKRALRQRGVLLDDARLFFRTNQDEPRCVVSLREPFGLTLVKSPERDRIVAVWSSQDGLFYVGTSLDKPARRTLGSLFDRAFTVLGDDAALEALGPDGQHLELSPTDFASLVLAVEEIDPACQRRLVLSDARGAPFRLDGRELVVGERKFDLEAPLEWRPFVFQEALGQSVTVYQGTSIRQGGSETVLVSLLPSFVPFEVRDSGQFDRTMLRDLRLVQAGPEDPPPRDARVAIDRLFVLPVRSALDTAPRANRRRDGPNYRTDVSQSWKTSFVSQCGPLFFVLKAQA